MMHDSVPVPEHDLHEILVRVSRASYSLVIEHDLHEILVY